MPRTPEYDRDAVIEQATHVFWERGYGQTSVSDLVKATGLNPGSLYAAFGSKKGVFLEVLAQYNQAFIVHLDELVAEDSASVLGCIRGLLDEIVEETVKGNDERGCLSVNSLLEMSQHDADISKAVSTYTETIRRRFETLLIQARDNGEIPADKDCRAASSFLLNNVWGMRVMCRSKPTRKSMQAIVDGVMTGLTA